MRLKYYLKGLGIGMIITALLMGLATREPSGMTDDEIKARAKELGMVEQKTLADTREEKLPIETEAPQEDKPDEATKPTEEPIVTKEPILTEEPNATNKPIAPEIPEPTQAPVEDTQNDSKEEVIVLEIRRGDSSDTVSARLEELGLIENASEYNNYLCDNGYDRKVNIGTYQLKIGMSDEEIAKIITKTR